MSTRQERLEQIEKLLLAHPEGLRSSEIAHKLGVSRSTVMRYLPLMEEAGVLLWEDGKGYLGIVNQRALSEQDDQLEESLRKLTALLDSQNNEEFQYQELFEQYPWILLGTQYTKIESHRRFDNKNIPDFTGIRAWEDYRDIIEIKPPFISLFRADGEFASGFNESWNQAERYLDFARVEKDYLRRKGLKFNNPTCFLILGFNLGEEQTARISTKQRMNPSIQVFTYNNILDNLKRTIDFVNRRGMW